MNQRPDARLLLDEMFSPAIAAELCERGHDVIAVADRPDLRSKSDEEIFAWASAERRWLLTENVKDFRPIMLRVLSAGSPGCGLLFTSSRAFPRSRKNPGPLVNALHAWLTAGPPGPPVTESWLLGAADSGPEFPLSVSRAGSRSVVQALVRRGGQGPADAGGPLRSGEMN